MLLWQSCLLLRFVNYCTLVYIYMQESFTTKCTILHLPILCNNGKMKKLTCTESHGVHHVCCVLNRPRWLQSIEAYHSAFYSGTVGNISTKLLCLGVPGESQWPCHTYHMCIEISSCGSGTLLFVAFLYKYIQYHI